MTTSWIENPHEPLAHARMIARSSLPLSFEQLSWLHSADRYRDAITAQRRAIAYLQEAGDRASEATAQIGLGQALGGSGRFDEAITAYRTAAAIFRELENPFGERNAMTNQGAALSAARRFGEAIAVLEQAVALQQTADGDQLTGSALTELGMALRRVGRYDEAISALESALAIARKLGHRELAEAAADDLQKARAARDGTRKTIRRTDLNRRTLPATTSTTGAGSSCGPAVSRRRRPRSERPPRYSSGSAIAGTRERLFATSASACTGEDSMIRPSKSWTTPSPWSAKAKATRSSSPASKRFSPKR